MYVPAGVGFAGMGAAATSASGVGGRAGRLSGEVEREVEREVDRDLVCLFPRCGWSSMPSSSFAAF